MAGCLPAVHIAATVGPTPSMRISCKSLNILMEDLPTVLAAVDIPWISEINATL